MVAHGLRGRQLFCSLSPECSPAGVPPGQTIRASLLIAPFIIHSFMYLFLLLFAHSFSDHLSCFCLLGPWWHKSLSQVLRIPPDLAHVDHTLLASQNGKGKLTKPKPQSA